MANVMLLIDDGFEVAEVLYPYYRMQEAGYAVSVVGPGPGIYHSKHGYPFEADKSPSEVRAEDFKAIIIPGGYAPDKMRTKPRMVELLREGIEKGLLIGSICHGAQMLIEAGALKGKKATCYVSVKTDIMNAGAMYVDTSVVTDGRLVTSRHPGDLPDFCRTLLEMLAK
ncbi:MAG: type 1 glutamine amidotransferase [Deltaproteobacteria bacterium]|nr:type 1 glutamine amidotransferase [Deltaproteobacteria bacterium]